MATNRPQGGMTRAEEMRILNELSEKIKKDPSIGIKIARDAGIIDENGKLTEYYRQPSDDK